MSDHKRAQGLSAMVLLLVLALGVFFLWQQATAWTKRQEEARAAREAGRLKQEEVRSQVQVIGRQWDGINEAALKDFRDVWGNRILVSTLSRGSLEVRSPGPDGMPYNTDDVCARFHTQSASRRLLGKPAEAAAEGLARGMRKGIKGQLKDE